MAAATPAGLRHGVGELARSRWGTEPDVEVEESDDLADPAALGVVLVAIGVSSVPAEIES